MKLHEALKLSSQMCGKVVHCFVFSHAVQGCKYLKQLLCVFSYCLFCRDSDDPEKVSRTDDGSATAAAQTAPPTVPPAPMTAPPPPMMGDMSGSYGSYSSWYQV